MQRVKHITFIVWCASSRLWGKCHAIEGEKSLFYAVFKAQNGQGNGFIFKTSKMGFYRSTKSKNQHFLKKGI